MSGFYGQLAKEALGDDVSDVSEGELDDMLANLGDLDADLFGKNIPKFEGSRARSETTAPIVSSKPTPIEKPAQIPAKTKKSELLSELFGADDDEETNASLGAPFSGHGFPSKSPEVTKVERPFPSKAMDTKNLDTDLNLSLSGSYMPLTGGERRKRNLPPRSRPAEDLWGEFLLPDDNLAKPVPTKSTEPDFQAAPTVMQQEDKPIIARKPNEQIALAPITNQNLAPAFKLELTAEMKEEILSMFKDGQEAFRKEVEEKIEANVIELREENSILKLDIAKLNDQLISQQDLIQDLESKIRSCDEESKNNLQQFEADFDSRCNDLQLHHKENLSDVQCQISQMEENLRDLQHSVDNFHPALASFKEKMSDAQNKYDEEMGQMEEHLNIIRESQLVDSKRIRKYLEEKLLKIASEMGDFDLLESKLQVLDGRIKKLVASVSNSRFEDDLVKKMDDSESGMLQKLNYCTNQQTRLENWHQQQLNDLSEHMNQRLWGLHRQVELNVSNVKVEIETLKRDMTNRLGEMEGKVTCAENETCRLSRLAERLCGLLQLWEMRNKESSKIQEVAEQSLRERFALVLAEKQLGGN